MTDITELAQRMSIERIKQIALGSTPTMGERESLAITALHFAEELKIATDAFQAAGLAQLAAEEALEKAQQVDEELCRLLPPGAEYMDPPDGGDVTPLEGVRRMVADYRQRIDVLESQLKAAENNEIDARCHIAELESRTVKLPDLRQIVSGDRYVWSDGVYNYSQDVKAILAAAGIKVEAE